MASAANIMASGLVSTYYGAYANGKNICTQGNQIGQLVPTMKTLIALNCLRMSSEQIYNLADDIPNDIYDIKA